MPMLEVKLYIYQLFRSLAYIHSQGICHRDIKPQNLLLDPSTGILKLCDFGSAKILVENEPNVSYICSRYYRAPELIFGATNYTTKIGKSWLIPPSSLVLSCWRSSRRVVHGLCDGWIHAWSAIVPWRVGNWPTGGNHQGSWNPYSGADPHHEPKLYGAQIPSNQATPIQQGDHALKELLANMHWLDDPRFSGELLTRPLIWSQLC